MKKALLILSILLISPTLASDDEQETGAAELKKMKIAEPVDLTAWQGKANTLLQKYGMNLQPEPIDTMRSLLTLMLTNYSKIIKGMRNQPMEEAHEIALEGLQLFPREQILPQALDLMCQIQEFSPVTCPPVMTHLMTMMESDPLYSSQVRFNLLYCNTFKGVSSIYRFPKRFSKIAKTSYAELILGAMPRAFISNREEASGLMRTTLGEVIKVAESENHSKMSMGPVIRVYLATRSHDPALFEDFFQFTLRQYPEKVVSKLIKTSDVPTLERAITFVMDQLMDPNEKNVYGFSKAVRKFSDHSGDLSTQTIDLFLTKLIDTLKARPSVLPSCLGLMSTSKEWWLNDLILCQLICIMRGMPSSEASLKAKESFFDQLIDENHSFMKTQSLEDLDKTYRSLKANGYVFAVQKLWQVLYAKGSKEQFNQYGGMLFRQLLDFFGLNQELFGIGASFSYVFRTAVQTKPDQAPQLHAFYEIAKRSGFSRHIAEVDTIRLLSRHILCSPDTSVTDKSQALNNFLATYEGPVDFDTLQQEIMQNVHDPVVRAYGVLAFQFKAMDWNDHRRRIPLQHQFIRFSKAHRDVAMPEYYTELENCFYQAEGPVKALAHPVKNPIIDASGRIYWTNEKWISGEPSRNVNRLYCSDAQTGLSIWETDIGRGNTNNFEMALGKDHLYAELPNGAIAVVDKVTGDVLKEIRVDPENEVGIYEIVETPSGSLFVAYGYNELPAHLAIDANRYSLFLSCLDLKSGKSNFNVPLPLQGFFRYFLHSAEYLLGYEGDTFGAGRTVVFNTRGQVLDLPGERGANYRLLANKLLKTASRSEGAGYSLTCQNLETLQDEWTMDAGETWLTYATNSKASVLFIGSEKTNTVSCVDFTTGRKIWEQQIIQDPNPMKRNRLNDLFLSPDETKLFGLSSYLKLIYTFDALTGEQSILQAAIKTSNEFANYLGTLPTGEIVLK